jgi:Holliday junction resolvase
MKKRINSRQKGKAGELELASILREHGYTARRGQQFKGGGDSPDVVGLPGVHIECKRVEQGNLYDWLAQAQRDAEGSGSTPVVVHRRNGKPWVVVMTLDDFLAMQLRRPI